MDGRKKTKNNLKCDIFRKGMFKCFNTQGLTQDENLFFYSKNGLLSVLLIHIGEKQWVFYRKTLIVKKVMQVTLGIHLQLHLCEEKVS